MPMTPKPVELHLLQGTYRKHRHGPAAPDGLPPLPAQPPDEFRLSAKEAAVWREVSAFGHLKAIDRRLVAMYCKVAASGSSNPATLIRLSRELQLSPATRRGGGAPTRPDASSDWSRLKQRTDQQLPVA
jgi:hypothetical protein